MTEETTVITEIRDHVVLMGLNRPAKLNSFNLQMLTELSEAYSAYENNDQLWCAVLHAHGDNFTSGLDLAEVGPAVASGTPLAPEGSVDPLDILGTRRTKPVVCVVQGWCITMGVELLLASDIRVAADNAKFAQMEVKRGIMPFGGATIRFPQIAGWGNAMRYLLTGDQFDAAEAFRIGLIQEVVETGKQLDRAIELAQSIAARAPLAVRATLLSSRTALVEGREAAIAGFYEHVQKLMKSEDAMEGMMSFIERRTARFKGK